MKIHILPAALAIALLFTGCSGKTAETAETISNQELNEEVYQDNVRRYNESAKELLGLAQEYAIMCYTRSGELKSGRYSGKTSTSQTYSSEDIEYTGKADDMAKYLSHYADSSSWGTDFVVMVNNGTPEACYTSDRDISSMDFSNYKEPTEHTMTTQVIGKAVAE